MREIRSWCWTQARRFHLQQRCQKLHTFFPGESTLEAAEQPGCRTPQEGGQRWVQNGGWSKDSPTRPSPSLPQSPERAPFGPNPSCCPTSSRLRKEEPVDHPGKAGFCMPSPNGLYDPPCKVACEGDTECPGAEKCCEHACHYKCMPPCREKAGHCPPPLMKKLNGPSLCDVVCAEDKDCPGMEKCCSTGCGFICTLPLEEKAGKCPRQRWVKRPLDGPCYDTCLQDQQCPGQMKCCFTGCSMSCIDVQREDPVDSDL